MKTVDLNCDLGEGFGVWEMGNDAAMIELATSVKEHEVIVRAIASGDPRAAQRSVETNWRNAAARLSRVIEQLGERGAWHAWDPASSARRAR